MSHATSVISNSRKSLLLGTSALVCLALSTPVMADDFVITISDGTTNGNIADNAINGSDGKCFNDFVEDGDERRLRQLWRKVV